MLIPYTVDVPMERVPVANCLLFLVTCVISLLILTGAFASLAWLLLGAGSAMVGASGAIMGIVGIFLVLFPKNDVNLFYWFGAGFVGSVNIAALWLILLYMIGDLLGTLAEGSAVAYI